MQQIRQRFTSFIYKELSQINEKNPNGKWAKEVNRLQKKDK